MSRPPTEHALRRQAAEVSRLLWERGWVANHDGNVSARLAPGRIVATPTALSKRALGAEDMLLIDESRRVLRGRRRIFSEVGLHLEVYAARVDVGAVVHAHPPYATARAVTGRALPCFLPEAVVSLGESIPLVPFALPGKSAEDSLRPCLLDSDAVLLAGHGVLSWGDDLEQAYLRMELVEHLSRVAQLAEASGGVHALPRSVLDPLLAARTRAGLGRRGRASR
ncbi:MAG: class II aldolase/adducin family protein [Deltaproteobacteria bacterium]|nr:class II aldolase/adducin family protein [Deltaproteobacteria bacterium]